MFSGRGYGHGVGLCQAGALARLRAGATPADVMRYYYPGVVVGRGSAIGDQGSWLVRGRVLSRFLMPGPRALFLSSSSHTRPR
jgi:hypothetical protein